MTAELRMTFADLGALEREIAQNLRHGRAFSSDVADVTVLSDCVLVLVHPLHAGELRLPAYVVMLSADGPMRGTGIELRPWSPSVLAQLEAFVHAPAAADTNHDTNHDAQDDTDHNTNHDAQDDTDHDTNHDAQDDTDHDTNHDAQDEDEIAAAELQFESKQDKLRHLSITDQMKIARTGELADRIVVERLYGKQVWEALLHNPRLSVPEVARIARKGTVPKPLLELIIDNAAWIKTPQVRRALFTNPKCGGDAIGKMLRVTPKHELKQIEKSTAYTQQVREAARKLLKQQER
jgi:hypothetical protein